MTRLPTAPRPLRARDPRLGPWRAFLAAHARVWRRLDEDLRAEHGLSLPEYEALLLLAQADERRLRMRAIADALQLSKSGVTRLVDRLVVDGLVERCQCPTDARGAEALLTTAGRERLRTAAPSHLRGIQAYFLAAIPGPELATLERALLRITERLPGPDPGRGLPGPIHGLAGSQAESTAPPPWPDAAAAGHGEPGASTPPPGSSPRARGHASRTGRAG